jgi:hypothetical protein
MTPAFPDLPLERWADTKESLHRFTQVVGKVRLAASPPRNHWWHVPLYVDARGVTTSPMSWGDAIFEIRLDHLAHRAIVERTDGGEVAFAIPGLTVADFHRKLMDALGTVGVEGFELPHPTPFDLGEPVPFEEDHRPRPYDRDAVTTYWQTLLQVDRVLKTFAGRWKGKTSPVHHFWHSFDIAVSRFSGRPAPPMPEADAVTQEAYTHEVASFGFWFGDENYAAPAFYSYTAPPPPGLADEPLDGPGASWIDFRGSPLAVMPATPALTQDDALAFLESAWQGGARLANFPEV